MDEHLRQVADAFAANTQPPSVAGATSDQVREILEAAERSVASLRADANREAADHVERVQQTADGMLTKLNALESELGRLLGALRASGERLTEGLAELQTEVGGAAVPARPIDAAPPIADARPIDAAPLSSDEAGARLAALNMALGGSSREETAAYLAEHFELADPDALLDDVYARAGR